MENNNETKLTAKYVVGIDLGTSNTALSYVDVSANSDGEINVISMPIPQVVSSGHVEDKPSLPSTLYISAGDELPQGAINLPWRAEDKYVVGYFAREQGAKVPTRYIHSAKSWFCHSGIDPEKKLLPPNTPEKAIKQSPADVAKKVLQHLIEAWNEKIAQDDPEQTLDKQAITLCVPASFDARARNLTVQVAEELGLKNLHLLEEPQAAIYSWIASMGRDWRKQVTKGDLILVVDVGGGTTDFSLIAVTEEEGELQLRRIAVGEHILLGGDNMDLALAHAVAQQLKKEGKKKLDDWQMAGLVQQCRIAKEAMLSDSELQTYPLAILGRGSAVIGGTVKTELNRELMNQLLLDGFFPLVNFDAMPKEKRRWGFKSSGLPYSTEPAITKHLAKFLTQHADLLAEQLPEFQERFNAQLALPTSVIFNGGVFKADVLRNRIMQQLSSWANDLNVNSPQVLGTSSLDLAVANGAAYLGMARQGKGVRIKGGSARSYYIAIESAEPAIPGMEPPMHAMCIVPYGMEEGTIHEISGEEIDLCLWTGQVGEFDFLSSTSRNQDQAGELCEIDEEELEFHKPIEAEISGDSRVAPIDLRAHYTDIGVLELFCVDRETQDAYKIEFNVREVEDGKVENQSLIESESEPEIA
ncbi:nucleotide-binding protein [Saccharobesus litoralis]|uniref:Nucleotide-binding protein n=1 Tax=Saccharobesus litoralis TaxID=2172099 RepID=A0A2S0VTL2_9ALTE|nr:Hsp70 family protein [Saccharobesus litoralis]AWB67558.1 nucleotide-binding protein [Saccharobesus litoralis]